MYQLTFLNFYKLRSADDPGYFGEAPDEGYVDAATVAGRSAGQNKLPPNYVDSAFFSTEKQPF